MSLFHKTIIRLSEEKDQLERELQEARELLDLFINDRVRPHNAIDTYRRGKKFLESEAGE